MNKAITFVNFTDKPFSHTWDSVPYDFAPGERYMMEDWKAEHFAKHLVNHVLNTMGKSVSDSLERQALLLKAMPSGTPTLEAADASSLATDLLNAPQSNVEAPTATPKKMGRPKKVVESDEDTFEGLKK